MTTGEWKCDLHMKPWHSHLVKDRPNFTQNGRVHCPLHKIQRLSSYTNVVKFIHTFYSIHLIDNCHQSFDLPVVAFPSLFRLQYFTFRDLAILLSKNSKKVPYISPDPAVADLTIGLHAGLFLICSCTLHIPSNSTSLIFFQNYILWTVRILALLVMQFFPTFPLLPLFYSEYFPWHSLLEPNAINIAVWCNSSKWLAIYWTIVIRTANKHRMFSSSTEPQRL